MAIKVWMPPKGFLEKRVNHPKSYHVLIDCKMYHYEQLHSCKRPQLEVRSRPAEHGAFKMPLCSCKLEASLLWAAACLHKPTADRKICPSNCCFTKLWRALWHLCHPMLSLMCSNCKPKESKTLKVRGRQKPIIIEMGQQLQDWIHCRLDAAAGTTSDDHLLSNFQSLSTVK